MACTNQFSKKASKRWHRDHGCPLLSDAISHASPPLIWFGRGTAAAAEAADDALPELIMILCHTTPHEHWLLQWNESARRERLSPRTRKFKQTGGRVGIVVWISLAPVIMLTHKRAYQTDVCDSIIMNIVNETEVTASAAVSQYTPGARIYKSRNNNCDFPSLMMMMMMVMVGHVLDATAA